jgi:hypothetical protein
MTPYQFIGVVAGLAILIGTPVIMICAAIDHCRHKASERPGDASSSAGIGAALQELDRVVRPSVEHVVDAQTPIVRTIDQDGD